jgi:hypothetical protein
MKTAAYQQRTKPPDLAESDQAKRRSTARLNAIPVWSGEELPRIAPGRYTAVAVRIIGPEFVRRWQRSSVGICFRPFSEPEAEVVLFLNLGKEGKPGRNSEYVRAYTLANGEQPRKGQSMDPAVFLDGQIYEIEVVDAELNSDGQRKNEAEVYSKVKRIVSVTRNPGAVLPIDGKKKARGENETALQRRVF